MICRKINQKIEKRVFRGPRKQNRYFKQNKEKTVDNLRNRKQNNFLIIIYWRQVKKMKNNFIPPFHKKEHENYNKTTPAFLTKNPQTICENTVKKMSQHADQAQSPNGNSFPIRYNSISQEGSRCSEQQSSCKSSETIVILGKNQQQIVRQERAPSPTKYTSMSPLNNIPVAMSIIKQNRSNTSAFIPMRATMKNLPLNKFPFYNNKMEEKPSKNGEGNKDMQLNSSYRINKTFTQMAPLSPPRGIEREFQKLREENESLRRELNQIKKNVGFGSTSKKEDLICNLRDTIKKQDSEIKELRVKIDIFTKKNTLLTTMIENKDQQIAFLMTKLTQTENQLREHKQKNAQKFQKLKERINFMIKSYNDLQVKWSQAEMEWLQFKQKWMQQKQMYFQRITFLEEYIGENCA